MERKKGLKFVAAILTTVALCSSVYLVVGQESRFTSSKTIQSYGTVAYLDRTHPGEVSHQANVFWLNPPIFSLKDEIVGYRFNVTVWLSLAQSSFAWQVKCTFDGTVFRVARIGYTAGATSQFFSGHNTISVASATTGSSATMGESLIGSDYRDEGNDSLCWFEFEKLATSAKEHFGIINNDTFALGYDVNEIVTAKYSAATT